MRTSLIEIKSIDDYVNGRLDRHSHAAAESRERKDASFMLGVALHKKILRLIGFYHKGEVRSKVDSLHDQIMNDPANAAFRAKINNLFKNDLRHD